MKEEFFPPGIYPSDLPTEQDILKKNLATFMVALDENLRSHHFKDRSEMDLRINNMSILLRFIFNANDKISVSWYYNTIYQKE